MSSSAGKFSQLFYWVRNGRMEEKEKQWQADKRERDKTQRERERETAREKGNFIQMFAYVNENERQLIK